MDEVKKPDHVLVVVYKYRSEVEQFRQVEDVALMVGGDLGQVLLTALATVRDDVIGRAV